jgi:nucleoside-diphosphate-sugar epimerase
MEAAYTTLRIRREPPMTRFVAAQLALDHYFAIDRARDLLGFQPQIDRDLELENCRSWLKSLAQSRFT